jgi:hypothetical protein
MVAWYTAWNMERFQDGLRVKMRAPQLCDYPPIGSAPLA